MLEVFFSCIYRSQIGKHTLEVWNPFMRQFKMVSVMKVDSRSVVSNKNV